MEKVYPKKYLDIKDADKEDLKNNISMLLMQSLMCKDLDDKLDSALTAGQAIQQLFSISNEVEYKEISNFLEQEFRYAFLRFGPIKNGKETQEETIH